ncbi:hypothetical protein [Mesorhizobium sp.]|uniref:hypothetical protein n=1 Tax=Mesorhizobium sp. TaxID=1871066 RepID=UPI000FE50662|nr:hypothetical protein [Mesorhizobium sp.]RWA62123.1 MAG: hypothetical protein EOQ27_15670 [Mesorhizobium sp.]
MSNVIQFPAPFRRLGVRTVPSKRLPGMWEVQVLEGAEWRAKAVAPTMEEARDRSAPYIVARLEAME